jgi:hypothetical protein
MEELKAVELKVDWGNGIISDGTLYAHFKPKQSIIMKATQNEWTNYKSG